MKLKWFSTYSLVISLILLLGITTPAVAKTETVLYSFCSATNCPDGAYPYSDLVRDASGNLYGTTGNGGAFGYGTVFELVNSSGTYTEKVLHSFAGPVAGGSGADGANPNGGLVMDSTGNLFGTTVSGGASGRGTVFELVNSSGSYTEEVLYSFGGSGDGVSPYAGLVIDASGNLYGTTISGGAFANGTVFELVYSSGTYTERVLYSFGVTPDGVDPQAGLALDASGNLYGTTYGGGAFSHGTVFELVNSSGNYTEKVLYNFTGTSGDGANPLAGLVIDASGNLYGTTVAGGSGCFAGCGTAFELVNFSGTYTEKVLHTFGGGTADAGQPQASLVMDASGNLYGTTYGGGTSGLGTVFELVNSSGSYTEKVLYSFGGTPDGNQPVAGLVMDTSGSLYGTTNSGGASGYGTVFEVTPAATGPAVSLSPSSLDFASVVTGTTSAAKTVAVTNSGSANLVLAAGAVTLSGANTGDFAITSDGCSGQTIGFTAPNNTCAVDVTFTPSAAASESASLNFADNAPGSPQSVSLAGTGVVTGPLVSFSGTTFSNGLTFPSQLVSTTSAAQTVSLTNIGVATLNILTQPQATGDFAVVNNQCGTTLAPLASCTFDVTFKPTVTGSDTGTVSLTDDAPFSPQMFSVTGTGYAPVPQISLPLAPAAVPASSAGFTLTVNGTGFVPGAQVMWNGVAVVTTFVSKNQLHAAIAAANVAAQGTSLITVVNPASVSNTSNAAYFEVTGPTPAYPLNRTDYPGSFIPNAVAVGDFNGDGKLDVAVAAAGICGDVCAPSAVIIYIGNGDGTFQSPASYTIGPAAAGIAVGDFNGDHIQDLAVTSTNGSYVTILTGVGDGTFAAGPTTFPTGTSPVGIVVGDFDGDGNLDIATADNNATTSAVSILLGNGDGTFKPHVEYGTGVSPRALTVGDFNRDGFPDLAVANQGGNSVSILLGNGNGTFGTKTDYASGPPTTSQGPTAIGTGDFNGDGILDLAVANTTSNTAGILIGNGNGTFQTATTYSTGPGPSSISIGDLDGDGNLDVVLVNQNGATTNQPVTLLTGSGTGFFSSSTGYSTGATPLASALADFNRDARMDLVTANSGDGTISVLMQEPVLSTDTSLLTFGNQVVGSTSVPQTITLTNTGSANLAISSVSLAGTNAADFTVSTSCPLVAQPGSCASTAPAYAAFPQVPFSSIYYVTAPNANGDRLVVGAPNGGITTLLSSLAALPFPTAPNQEYCDFVALSHTIQAFAYVPTAAERTGDFSAFAGLLVDPSTGLVVPGGTLSTSSTFWAVRIPANAIRAGSIQPGASCTISVSSKPVTTGALSATVLVSNNADDEFQTAGALQTVSLTATGTAPVAILSPTSLTFASQLAGTTSAGQTVTVSNTGGTAPLTLTNITITGTNASDFALANNYCLPPLGTGSVAINSSCTFDVTFTPTAYGARSASVSVTDNALTSPQSVPLSGTGNAPVVSFSPMSLNFSYQVVGSTSASQTVTLANAGNTTLTITAMTASGDFALTNDTCVPPLGTGSLAATQTCNFGVTFTPTATGSRTGAITLTGNASGTLPLTGTGAPIRIININSTTNIVNINGAGEGAHSYNSNQTLWFQPFTLDPSGQLLELPVQAGTYSLTIIDSADAAAKFPSLTPLQLSQIGAGWTYNCLTCWITNYLVYDQAAATNSALPQIIYGAGSSVIAGSAQGAYNATVAAGNATTYYKFMSPTTLIFAVPDYLLTDNAGTISVLVQPYTPPANTLYTSVPGTAGPWNFASGGLNSAFPYGVGDQGNPVAVNAASGLSFGPGSALTVKYVNNFVSDAGTSSAGIDANGNPCCLVNNNLGSNGQPEPSYYVPSSQYPAYLAELIGVFTDANGTIVGSPFKVGDSGTFVVPSGATQLQLGTNDDIHADNVGSWVVSVSVANPVPLINQPLVPTSVAPGGAAFTLTVNGTGFVQGSTLKWNGTSLATTFVSPSRITAAILATEISAAGTASVTVANPPPGGGTSNVVYLTIATPVTSPTFANATGSPFTEGSGSPVAVAVGDFNGDGKLDMAVANQPPTGAADGNVSVLLGNGDGTYTQAPSSVTVGGGAKTIAVGDFNGDGKLDLAVVSDSNVAFSTPHPVVIWLGKGDGTFTEGNAYLANVTSLAVGDFNGDGRLDLAVGWHNPQFASETVTVTVLLGNGDGTFAQAPGTLLTPVSPNQAATADFLGVGDFNGDGKLDLAVANGGLNAVNILLGNGDGTFTQAPYLPGGAEPLTLVVADFNGDGKLDLAAADFNGSTVTVLLGNGDGTFTPTSSSPATGANPEWIVGGDFNNDGKFDLATVNDSSDNVTILLGRGNGTFTPAGASPATGLAPVALAAGDFDGDGRLDLAAANFATTNNLSVLLQQAAAGAPALTLSATSLTMPTTPLNLTCTPRTVTLTNTGTGALAIQSIVSSDNALFAISSNTCPLAPATLAAGVSCSVSVTFHPAVTGTVTGTLTITSNAPGSPHTVGLSGTGQPACPLAAAATSERVLRGTDQTTFTIQPNVTCQSTDQIALACANANPATCAFNPGSIQNPQRSLLTMRGLNSVTGNTLPFQVTGTSPDFIQRTLDLAVNFSDFWFSAYPSEKTVQAGDQANFSLTVVPINGLTGQLNLSCSGAPSGGSCTVSPSSITLAKDAPVQFQVKVQTASRAMVPLGKFDRPGPGLPLRIVIIGVVGLLALGLAGSRRPKDEETRSLRGRWCFVPQLRAAYFLLPILLLIITWASCGGGGTSRLGGGGTPVGRYSIVVTGTFTPSPGSGMIYDPNAPALSRNTSLTLNVQ